MNINEQEIMTRRTLPIIYILDTSGSMTEDGAIGKLNEGLRDTIIALQEIENDNENAEIKIGVLQFATAAEWITPHGLVHAEDFHWNDLKAAGTTEVGRMLVTLEEKMSRKEFFDEAKGQWMPVLIFVSDGYPTDPDTWESVLEKVKNGNKWFKNAIKIAFALGDNVDKEFLRKITCCEHGYETVIPIRNMDQFKEMIKLVSVKSSMLGTTSRMAEETLGAQIVTEAINAYDDKQDADDSYYNVFPQPVADNFTPLDSDNDPFCDDYN